MPDLQVFLIPKTAATRKQLRQLWSCIDNWLDHEDESNFPTIADPLTLDDLRSGELPAPLALRETIGPFEIPQAYLDLLESRGGDPSKITEEERLELKVGFQPPEPGALKKKLEELGRAASLRGVRIWYGTGKTTDRERLRAMLHRFVPNELVEEVLVNGKRMKGE